MRVTIYIQKECSDSAEAKTFKNRIRTLLKDEENIKVSAQQNTTIDMKTDD